MLFGPNLEEATSRDLLSSDGMYWYWCLPRLSHVHVPIKHSGPVKKSTYSSDRECGGVVVERGTPNREVLGWVRFPQAAPCCVIEQDTLTPYSTG